MGLKLYEESDIQAIGDSIRRKNGSDEKYKVRDMSGAVDGIPSGGFWDEETVKAVVGKNLGVSVTELSLPEGLTSIGNTFFAHQENTSGIMSLELPQSVKMIDSSAFNRCFALKKITLNNGLEKIQRNAFYQALYLSEMNSIPASVTTLGKKCFSETSLQEITFEGTPTNIDSNSLDEGLLTIRVPWEEGEVAGAPWGAVNATIIYNYTGEE